MPATATNKKPAFLVTIDTEGDNQWARGHVIETRNAGFLPRFQALCEKYGVRPTWLTNWEMATAPQYQEFARDVLARETGEIGMHLHAWNSPPEIPLTADDYKHHPYLVEFPEHLIREKVKIMTHTLEEVFGVKMVSHRAGRFSFDEVYARALVENGYLVDSSVTPGVSWKAYAGDPNKTGGTDFSKFPREAYFLDPMDIKKKGDSPILEIPVTITMPRYAAPVRGFKRMCSPTKFTNRVARHFYPDLAWLYPKGYNHPLLPLLLDAVLESGMDHAMFMIHSSELMPGGSPNFPTDVSIEKLYTALETVFEKASRQCVPMTMKEYHARVVGAGMVGTAHAPAMRTAPELVAKS